MQNCRERGGSAPPPKCPSNGQGWQSTAGRKRADEWKNILIFAAYSWLRPFWDCSELESCPSLPEHIRELRLHRARHIIEIFPKYEQVRSARESRTSTQERLNILRLHVFRSTEAPRGQAESSMGNAAGEHLTARPRRLAQSATPATPAVGAPARCARFPPAPPRPEREPPAAAPW